MAKRGRPRKSGPRTASGAPTRAKVDRGNPRTAAKYERFGSDGSDAIGRAYRANLLGHHGKALLDASRAIFRAYWPMLEVGRNSCTLADRGGGTRIETERDKARETWLLSKVRGVDAMGHDIRRAFDELVIDVNPDSGPPWLDRLLNGGTERLELDKALQALKVLAGVMEYQEAA
jgi:hypothetical protein